MFLLFSFLALPGQPAPVRGQVIAGDSNKALAGAHVLSTGPSYRGTLTNEESSLPIKLKTKAQVLRLRQRTIL